MLYLLAQDIDFYQAKAFEKKMNRKGNFLYRKQRLKIKRK